MSNLDITIKYSKEDKARLEPHLKNWLLTHTYIRKLPNSEATLIELRKMITLELALGGRTQMISRLRSRFIAVRKQLEDELLFSKIYAA